MGTPWSRSAQELQKGHSRRHLRYLPSRPGFCHSRSVRRRQVDLSPTSCQPQVESWRTGRFLPQGRDPLQRPGGHPLVHEQCGVCGTGRRLAAPQPHGPRDAAVRCHSASPAGHAQEAEDCTCRDGPAHAWPQGLRRPACGWSVDQGYFRRRKAAPVACCTE